MEQKTSFVDFLKKVIAFMKDKYWNIRAGMRKMKWFFVRMFRTTRRFFVRMFRKIKSFFSRIRQKSKWFFVRIFRKVGRFFVRMFRKAGRIVVKVFRKIKQKFIQIGRAVIRFGRRIKRFFIRSGRAVKRFFVRLGRRIKRAKHNPKLLFDISGLKTSWKRRRELGSSEKALAEREAAYKKGFLEQLQPILDAMPVSNGSRYYEKIEIKIAIIADEFLFDSFKDIAEFIYITPDDYEEYIDKVDFLLVASAWRGLHNEWRLMATEGKETNEKLHQTITAYKEAGKTVVFYSKEDPPNYEHFLPIAKRADIIFTSCVEKIEDYKRDCGIEKVNALTFCINPVFHNPIGMKNRNKKDGIFFAGSWMLKYPERVKALEMMLDASVASGKEVTIADRNFSQNNINYFFPKKYYSYLVKEIPHDYLQKVHKLYEWAININSITESKTMFANRVYELQANGCLMLSNRSVGVQEQFDEVIIVETPEDVESALNRYDSEEIYRHQINGVRRVMTGETCFDRVKYILNTIGYEISENVRKVLVVAEQITPAIKEMFANQSYQQKDLVELSELTEELYSKYDMVTKWDTNSKYEKYYLEDMINGFKYTNSDYITKSSYIENGTVVGDVEHDYVDTISNCYATVIWREAMSMHNFVALKSDVALSGGYSIDHFNYEKQ